MVKCELNLGVDDLKDYCQMIRRLLAELLGTFIYIALLLSGNFFKQLNPLANGLLVASVLIWILPVSGGHINPAITLGAFICSYINLFPALLYMIAQICGALLGQLVANAISSRSLQIKDAEITSLFVLEMLKTFLVVAVAMNVLGTPFTAMRLGPIAIGLSIVACLSSTTDYRALMNPAASLAVAVYYRDFSNHWLFWAAPLLGGLIAGLVHKFVLNVKLMDRQAQISLRLPKRP